MKTCKLCGKEYKQSKNEPYCSKGCKDISERKKLEILDSMTELQKEIIKLYNSGLSYKKISSELGCSKSTVAYWCNDTTKQRAAEKKSEYQESNKLSFRLSKNLDHFKRREENKTERTITSS